MARADILAVVEDQFYDVGKRLDGVGKRLDGVGKRLERHMTRTAEIQQELKGQTKEIAELRRTVNLAHRLLKELLARIP